MEATEQIRKLNDDFRKTMSGDKGITMMTQGVSALPPFKQAQLVRAIRAYDRFTKHNDPYEEHDMGTVNLDGRLYYFKIDYYDQRLEYLSEDPTDPKKTKRVMTIMHASEY